MIRTEAERQFYLGVAGVRLWYARSPLPGAAPSPEFEFPEEVSAATEELRAAREPAAGVRSAVANKPAGKSEKPSRAVNLQSLMETSAPESSGTTAVSPSNGPEAKSEQEAGAANDSNQSTSEFETAPFRQRLNLRLWVGRRFVLVSDLSEEASLRLQETLAANILKSIGDRDPQVLGPISWPVFNNPLLPGNQLPDLVDVLKGVLEALDGQRVILLGVPGSGAEATGDHWFARALGREPELVFPHTLAELAGNPELKKNLWQLLKPFA
ncbi:2-isopropylmalate synthase [Marinobacter sp. DUT-1]|uniref:2-isopropylmalate synthase n=1 Tax=Marinobacter sp. DUT-1 TaxID=3412037 RepID=UPI003D169389